MNIHIIKEADGNGIVAVFGSRTKSPASLEREVLKAMDNAMDSDTSDIFVTMAGELEKENIVWLQGGGTTSWEFTVSEY